MFRTFLAQVWYDKAVWEENKWNDEILHSFTAVLRINHLCNTPQAYLTRNLMKTLRIQLFFSAPGTSVLGSKTNTLLAWSWETRKRCVCFFSVDLPGEQMFKCVQNIKVTLRWWHFYNTSTTKGINTSCYIIQIIHINPFISFLSLCGDMCFHWDQPSSGVHDWSRTVPNCCPFRKIGKCLDYRYQRFPTNLVSSRETKICCTYHLCSII